MSSEPDGFDYELKAKATLTDGTEATIYRPTREKSGKYEFKNPDGDWVELKDNKVQLDTGWYSYTKSRRYLHPEEYLQRLCCHLQQPGSC